MVSDAGQDVFTGPAYWIMLNGWFRECLEGVPEAPASASSSISRDQEKNEAFRRKLATLRPLFVPGGNSHDCFNQVLLAKPRSLRLGRYVAHNGRSRDMPEPLFVRVQSPIRELISVKRRECQESDISLDRKTTGPCYDYSDVPSSADMPTPPLSDSSVSPLSVRSTTDSRPVSPTLSVVEATDGPVMDISLYPPQTWGCIPPRIEVNYSPRPGLVYEFTIKGVRCLPFSFNISCPTLPFSTYLSNSWSELTKSRSHHGHFPIM